MAKMPDDAILPDVTRTAPSNRDVPANRRCLRCNATFWSDGFGERVCPRCKSTVSWRNFVPAGSGRGHGGKS